VAETEKESIIRTSYALFELIDDSMVRIQFNKEPEITAEIAADIRKQCDVLTQGKAFVVLCLPEDYTSITNEALQFFSKSQEGIQRKAIAFLVNSLAQRLMGNAFIHIFNPDIPTKLFTSEEEAVKWLNSMQSKR